MTLNERLCSLGCRRDRDVGRDRSYIGQVGFWRFWFDWLKRSFVFDKFVEDALDRFSCLIRTGIAHVVVSKVGLYDINSGFLTDLFRRDNAGISLEDGILSFAKYIEMSAPAECPTSVRSS